MKTSGLAAPATAPKAMCRVARSSLRTVAAAGPSASRTGSTQQLERRPQQMRRPVAARAAAVSVRAETIAVTFTLKQKASPSPAVLPPPCYARPML